jgi:replicative DNA helicase Mcm
MHCYDDETEVLTNEGFKFWRDLKGTELLGNVDHETGKFLGFCIPEEFICKYYSGQVYDYNDKDIDLVVTPNHNLYAHSIRVYNDRFTLFPKLFQANYPASLKSRYDTVGECAMKMLSCTSGTIGNNKFELGHMNGYCFGQLCGFFIGDGYANLDITGRNSISFHLRRPRKILYLNEICRKLNLELMTTKELYKVKFPNIGNVFRESFYNDCKEKTMPLNFFSCSEDFLLGVLDGLRNSDGSTKRNTWVYSTKSSELSERIRIIGTIVGQSFSVTGKDKKGTIILNAATKKYILVNDPRKDRVKIRQYEGNVYCASVPGKVLVVRRNGRIILSGNSSPAEHQATPDFWINNPLIITIMGENNLSPESAWNSDRIWCNHSKSGNLGPGWVQYRKLLPNEAVAPLPKAYR